VGIWLLQMVCSTMREFCTTFQLNKKQTPSANLSVLKILTQWSWTILERPLVWQLLNKFPASHGARRFITVFTRTVHWIQFGARSIQYIPPNHLYFYKIYLNIIYLRLGLNNGLFPSGFPTNMNSIAITINIINKTSLSFNSHCVRNR
jgi:hypothetical protein